MIDTSELFDAPVAESSVLGQLYADTYKWLGLHGIDEFGPLDKKGETYEGLPLTVDPPLRSYTVGFDAARRIVPAAVTKLDIVEDLELDYKIPHYLQDNDENGTPIYELEQPDCSFTLKGEHPLLPNLNDFLLITFDAITQQWVSNRMASSNIPLSDERTKILQEREQAKHMTQPEAEALVEIIDSLPAIHTASL